MTPHDAGVGCNGCMQHGPDVANSRFRIRERLANARGGTAGAGRWGEPAAPPPRSKKIVCQVVLQGRNDDFRTACLPLLRSAARRARG